jgi:hypothetical protein
VLQGAIVAVYGRQHRNNRRRQLILQQLLLRAGGISQGRAGMGRVQALV